MTEADRSRADERGATGGSPTPIGGNTVDNSAETLFTEDMTTLITCERCGRQTADPDRWDPEADTGRIFCDGCWDVRNLPLHTVTIVDGGGTWWPRCSVCGPLAGQDYEGDAEAVATRHEEIGGFG